jgi:osmotically-inducible protein OsmY
MGNMMYVSSKAFKTIKPIALIVTCLSPCLTGCAGAILTGAVGGATLVAQERTVGQAVDDAGIQLTINEKMFVHDNKLFLNVNLTVTQGNVVMTGVVPTPEDKVTAAKLAWQVNGVASVANELQVTKSSSLTDMARDTWITAQLRARMLGDAIIRDINYTLDTVNGVVYVMGISRNQEELNAVLTHARTVNYVKRVVSLVRLSTPES